jgi:hypothetical protein
LRGLGRDSVPEFKPTRERKFWYPRNAGFKRAKAEDELKRMIAAAKAKGLDESSVDSIYSRRGTKEFEEFERRNGFDKEVGESGLLMVQHGVSVFQQTKISKQANQLGIGELGKSTQALNTRYISVGFLVSIFQMERNPVRMTFSNHE